ncbi:sugar phosphate isomerase/epimerase [Hoeflea marina]|uniref:Sugar phosphate isomerase/epimerase n=1 Tax=Hoeflea marina TaxID=274592 RepID=A0A317PR11_9HYPH|nr:TIM barrel protein [Hoeflea marina]PWW03377.1 sugar phosphate isomerase/epimerase [Hoeflea marina]
MAQQYFSMDFAFYSSMGVYSFDDRCEITKATGYDAIHLTLWDGRDWTAHAQQIATVKKRFDLDIAGVYVVLDLSVGEADLRNSGIIKLIEAMPEGSTIDLAIKSAGTNFGRSDPKGDAAVMAWLNKALVVAAARRSRILIYTHIQFWAEKHGDALRLCEKINHPNLGLTFSALQWYMGEGRNLAPLLRRAMPFIKQANFSGSRRSPLGFFEVATIEPLDMGELDNFAVLALLTRLGYQGALGYNGWHEGGDTYNKLERSLHMLKDLVARLKAHPHWGSHIDA